MKRSAPLRTSLLAAALTWALTSFAAHAAGTIDVQNFVDGETIRYPAPLIMGLVPQAGPGAEITVRNTHPEAGESTITGVMHEGRFKVLTELQPGTNRLELVCGPASLPLSLVYQPQTTPYVLRFFYITDNTGETDYISPLSDDPQNFREKIDTGAKLMQSFCAESMWRNGYGRKTFNLEFDEDGELVVHLLKSPKPRSYFHENSSFTFYDHVAELVNRDYPAGHRGPGRYGRNMGIVNVTEFDPEQKKVVGGVALGSPRLALFGSGALYSWPNDLGDTFRAFSDATPIDSATEFDDSAGRSARWALASTTIGACVHEFGHGFGLPHARNPLGIMRRGFDHFARMFNLIEPPSRHNKVAFPIREEQAARWCTAYASRLRYSPFLSLDPPVEPPEQGWSRPTVTRDGQEDSLELASDAGITWIGLFDFNRGDLYLDDTDAFAFDAPFPTEREFSLEKIQKDVGVHQVSIGVQDRYGVVTYSNPKELQLGFPPEVSSLATGKPVTTSSNNDGFDGGKAVDGSLDRESRWDGAPFPQWLQVDLEKVQELRRIRYVPYWDGSRHYRYRLSVSTDGKRWKDVADGSDNAEIATQDGYVHTFPAEKARYVRVDVLENSANVGAHVVELLVYGVE